MKPAAILVLFLFVLANAGIILYFFVYKQREADREYDEAMKRLFSRHGGRGRHK
jgi:hypothetical protein